MWTYCEEAIEAIESRKHHHSGLDLLKKAMKELDDPQDNIRSIHIGGTNGKGSSVDYIRSILNEAGYKVGTFTSPYLVSHHDRIRINNVNISDQKLLYYINEYESLWRKYELSMFEIDMMIASLYFQEEKTDVAIFEVGMGGRLDATNILKKPCVCAITNIGMDHMQYLGDTPEKIAYEKAGIIKKQVDCIGGSENPACIRVFEEICKKQGSHYIRVGDCEQVQWDRGLSFIYKKRPYHVQSMAAYQRKNAALAIETSHYLNNCGFEISQKSIEKGLMNTQWLGRFEIVHQNPLVILDGAHNEDGMRALVESMKPFKDIHVIFSCLNDKNGGKMIEKLLSISDDVTVCEFDYYRAEHADHLSGNYPVKVEKNYMDAIEKGLKKEGVLLISGSLYFISLVRKYFI